MQQLALNASSAYEAGNWGITCCVSCSICGSRHKGQQEAALKVLKACELKAISMLSITDCDVLYDYVNYKKMAHQFKIEFEASHLYTSCSSLSLSESSVSPVDTEARGTPVRLSIWMLTQAGTM